MWYRKKMNKEQKLLKLQKRFKKSQTRLPLHGRYPLRTDNGDVDTATAHQWFSSSSLKGETEGFILATQGQSLTTRMCQAKILKNGADQRWRLSTHSEETIDHMISGCPTIVNTEYLQRHDRVAKFIQWTLCRHYEIPHTEK